MWIKGKRAIRDVIKEKNDYLWHRIETIWNMAKRRFHGAQTSDYNYVQGTLHCERVEQNLGVLIPDEWKEKRISAMELFILSATAALHDSGKRRYIVGDHGIVAARAMAEHPEKFGLETPEADAIGYIVKVHNTRRLGDVPERFSIGLETIHLRTLAAIFCLADTLHCDYSRVLKSITDESERKAIENPVTLFRLRVYGFDIDTEGRILLTFKPQKSTETRIIQKGLKSIKEHELKPLLPKLRAAGYPYRIFLRREPSSIKDEIEEKEISSFILDYAHAHYYDVLNHFENSLRQFIKFSMKRAFGENWWKQRIPRDVQEKCLVRKEEKQAKHTHAPLPLILYTDFFDYAKIMTRRDNWREVFKGFFESEEWIRVKLKELNSIRTDIAHTREVRPEDQQKLRLYATEILRCISNSLVKRDDTEFLQKLNITLVAKKTEPLRVDLPTVEHVLRKEESKTPDFFKKEPEWVDFEKGYVVEHEKVETVIRDLEQNPIQVVLGDPASGKSVMLKNVAFKLSNHGWNIYIIEFKKYSEDQINEFFENVLTVDDKEALVVLDDAHLYLHSCEAFVRRFRVRNLRSKVLIGSRRVKELIEEHPKEPSPFDRLKKTEISSGDTAEKIVALFLRNEYGLDDEAVRNIAEKFKYYKHDLWHLSWALKAYVAGQRRVEESDIYRKIKDSIRNIVAGQDKPSINAEDALLAPSVFYRFEIPVERSLLEKQLAIEGTILDQLIDLGEIETREEIGKKKTIRLNHSSIAELYFRTYQIDPDLGGRVKEIVQAKFGQWDVGLFHMYFQSKPEQWINPLSRLSHAFKNGFLEYDLLATLLKNNQTKEMIFERALETIRNVKRLNSVLQRISSRVFSKELVGCFSKKDFYRLWNQSKLNHIGVFLGWRAGYHSSNVRKAYASFSKESFLRSKMEEATLDEIRVFVNGISQIEFRSDPSRGKKLVNYAVQYMRGLPSLPQKVKDSNVKTIRLLIKNLAESDSDPELIIDQIRSPFNLGAKLSESSLNDINMLILSVERTGASPKFIVDCIKQMKKKELIGKLEESPLQYIDYLIRNIKRHDIGLHDSIIEILEELDLTQKLKESDLRHLSSFIWSISSNTSLAPKYAAYVDDLDLTRKMEEADLKTVNYLLWHLYLASPTLPKTFIDDHVLSILKNRLNERDASIGEKLRLIGIFQFAGYTIMKKEEGILAIEISKPELEFWLGESFDNPAKIALALNGLKVFDEETALSFIDSNSRLDDIIDCLKNAEIENIKTEQLIKSTIEWLSP